MARLFNYVLEHFGSAETFAFFYHVRLSFIFSQPQCSNTCLSPASDFSRQFEPYDILADRTRNVRCASRAQA